MVMSEHKKCVVITEGKKYGNVRTQEVCGNKL